MTWDNARKLMQQENLFIARKSWVGYRTGEIYKKYYAPCDVKE